MKENLDFAIQEVESVLTILLERGTIRQKEADILIEPLYVKLQLEINKENDSK